jgi:hypothetical protein
MDPADIQKFSHAVIKGATMPNQANTDKFYAGDMNALKTAPQEQANSTKIGIQADAEAKAAEAARQSKIQQLQDMSDPNKYKAIRKNDGGFDFKDPAGNPIDINTYAQRTGISRADILKNSDNPVDQQFVNDYNNVNTVMQAAFNKDQATVDEFKRQNNVPANMPINDYLKNVLIKKYPHLYGLGSYGDTVKNFGNPGAAFSTNNIGSSGGSTGAGDFQL